MAQSHIQSHTVIQVGPYEPKDFVKLPCAICLLKSKTGANTSLPGTMRCKAHMRHCATCTGQVSDETHLSCHFCWKGKRMEREMGGQRADKYLASSSSTATLTAEHLKDRSLEEGQVDRLTPPSNSEPDYFAISF